MFLDDLRGGFEEDVVSMLFVLDGPLFTLLVTVFGWNSITAGSYLELDMVGAAFADLRRVAGVAVVGNVSADAVFCLFARTRLDDRGGSGSGCGSVSFATALRLRDGAGGREEDGVAVDTEAGVLAAREVGVSIFWLAACLADLRLGEDMSILIKELCYQAILTSPLPRSRLQMVHVLGVKRNSADLCCSVEEASKCLVTNAVQDEEYDSVERCEGRDVCEIDGYK